MENMHKNSSIKCSVHECKYNMGTENYCSLDVISVGTHEPNPTVPECTDCKSFRMMQIRGILSGITLFLLFSWTL